MQQQELNRKLNEVPVVPVVLCGGMGQRLWPLSDLAVPKPFLPLFDNESLFQKTLHRVKKIFQANFLPILIGHRTHRALIMEQAHQAGYQHLDILLEPLARNTAFAVAVSVIHVMQKYKEALMLLLPSDHLIADEDEFLRALSIAKKSALGGHLVTFGVKPTRPETGYGYIQAQGPLCDGVYPVHSFIEKPQETVAQQFIKSGSFFWNSGMLLFQASEMANALHRFAPTVMNQAKKSYEKANKQIPLIELEETFLQSCPSISIDYAVMEYTDKATLVPVNCGWCDVGSWQSIWEKSQKDANGNVIHGNISVSDTQNSYLWSDGQEAVISGVNNMIVVATKGKVLMLPKEKSAALKTLLEPIQSMSKKEVLFSASTGSNQEVME